MSWAVGLIVTMVAAGAYLYVRERRQLAFISGYRFHVAIRDKLRERRPELSDADRERVLEALRQYFRMCRRARRRVVAMPSQVVDDAWHAFILYTRAYKEFCRRALGRFLHHTPAQAMRSPTDAQDAIKRAWRLACQDEGIDPRNPSRLPLIFALDGALNIPGGFTYQLRCDPNGSGYCASHIGCGGGCGGDSSGSADGSGCSGGCGGD